MEEEDNVDIESQMGFFEHYDPNDDDDCTCCEDDESDERERKCSDLFGLFGYTVLVLLIVLNLDLLLSTYNANSGLVNWNSWASGGEPAGYEVSNFFFELVKLNDAIDISFIFVAIVKNEYLLPGRSC